jgi:hypothetical protein
MYPRSADWLEVFSGDVERIENDEMKSLVMEGQIEICPCCGELSAYAWDNTNAYDFFTDGIIPGGFIPASGSVAHIGCCSGMGEWECGHCGSHLVEQDSLLLAECYTHVDDGSY